MKRNNIDYHRNNMMPDVVYCVLSYGWLPARLLIMITLFTLFTGCSASWHLRQAMLKGATEKVDTVFDEKKVTTKEVVADTVVKNRVDTVYLTKENLRVIVRIKRDTIEVEGRCDPVVTTIHNPVIIKKAIEAPPCIQKIKWWWLPIALVLGYLLCFFVPKR